MLSLSQCVDDLIVKDYTECSDEETGDNESLKVGTYNFYSGNSYIGQFDNSMMEGLGISFKLVIYIRYVLLHVSKY
jgi:hypothetical protein